MYAKYPDTFVDEASRDVLEDTDACLEMMFPTDGYEVQAERRWEPEHLPTVLCARIGARHHTQLG